MSTRSGPPSSIDGIKRLAKNIASEKSIKHTAALHEAARAAGYQNFLHAKRQLSRGSHAPRNDAPNSTTRTSRNMTVSDFHAKARSEWIAKINMNVPAGDHSRTWTTPHSIAEVLQPFMGSSANHGHLPTGGGFDFLNVSLSREPGCLEFGVSGSTFLLAKPRRLVLERIDRDTAQSFLMLELDDLDPSGVYDDATNTRLRDRRDEEVVDIGRGEYVARDGYDDGSFIDPAGHRRDLPEGSRLIVRLLGGQIMFVTKGSLWNGSPQTYRGLHDSLSIVEIRRMIENALDRSE